VYVWIQAPDEGDRMWTVVSRTTGNPTSLQPIQNALVETDPEVLGLDLVPTEQFDVMRKRRRDQVEHSKAPPGWQRACDLSYEEAGMPAQRPKLSRAEEGRVLYVDDVRLIVTNLLERDLAEQHRSCKRVASATRKQIPYTPKQSSVSSVLQSPTHLKRLAVHDYLDGVVPKFAQVL